MYNNNNNKTLFIFRLIIGCNQAIHSCSKRHVRENWSRKKKQLKMERNKKLHINIWTDVGNKMTYFDGTGCFHICCTISASFCRRKQESEIKEKML